MEHQLPITPALLAEYATLPLPPLKPNNEEMLMMHPVSS
jgi:hypothetical protein